VTAHALERRKLMPAKFNGPWKIRNGRAIPNSTNFVTDNVNITVAPYAGSSFTFTMGIDGTEVAFPATDAADRFTIGPHTHSGNIYDGDVWRIEIYYGDDKVEEVLAGIIKRVPADCITDSDTVSFTAIKTG
jgi:hypothetical protein